MDKFNNICYDYKEFFYKSKVLTKHMINMDKLASTKYYSLITGIILFLFGFFGFAFRNNFQVSGKYLLISLVLGFWGIVISVGKKDV